MDENNVKEEPKMEKQDAVPLTNAGSFAEIFSGIPMGSLICEPLTAAAKGRKAMGFHMVRPVNPDDEAAKEVTIKAPLISMVPIPELTVDKVTVDFEMEVKESNTQRHDAKIDEGSTVNIDFGKVVHATIAGNAASDGKHKCESGSTDSIKIHECAAEQSPSEGMEKLTSLLEKGKHSE